MATPEFPTLTDEAVAELAAGARRSTIREGDWILMRGGENRIMQIRGGTTVKLGRSGHVHVGGIVGKAYGTFFVVDEGSRTLVVATDVAEATRIFSGGDTAAVAEPEAGEAAAAEAALPATADAKKDNRDLRDTNTSQKLSSDDIARLKESQGLKGIVTQLVQSSASFENKTAFSQEKYIKKKAKKYQTYYLVEALTVDRIAEAYNPTKSMDVRFVEDPRAPRPRVDTIAQLLSLANVHGGGQVMVVDHTPGSISAAVMDRLAAGGRMVQVLRAKEQPNLSAARQQLMPAVKERWSAVHWDDLLGNGDTRKKKSEDWSEAAAAAAAAAAAKDSKPQGEPRFGQWVRGPPAREWLLASPSASFLVATEEDPAPIVRALWPFFALSGTLAVFSPYLSALERLFSVLRDELGAILINIRETWFRDQQVLPNRTHPLVNMSHNGGYILSCTKVEPHPSVVLANSQQAAAETAEAPARKAHRTEGAQQQ